MERLPWVPSLSLFVAAVIGCSPLIHAAAYGSRHASSWSGAFLEGYAFMVALFIPVAHTIGQFTYVACLKVFEYLARQASDPPRSGASPWPATPGLIMTTYAGVAFTQAIAEPVRWVVSVPASGVHGLVNGGAIAAFAAVNVIVAPILESLVVVAAAEVARRVLSVARSALTVGLAAGALHALEVPISFFATAALVSFCTATYLHARMHGAPLRSFLAIATIHIANNLAGLALLMSAGVLGYGAAT